MSLRARITLAIVALAAFALVIGGGLTQRLVVRPLADNARTAFAAQAVFVSLRMERGEPALELEETFDVDIRFVEAPPAGARDVAASASRRGRRRGRVVAAPRSPELFVRTRSGWVGVKPGLDLERPGRRLLQVLLVGGVVLTSLAFAIASASTQPLQRMRRAMDTVSRGDLDHRLPESGSTEVVAVGRAFNAMTTRVQALLTSEKELLAGVSHELRTPITRLRLAVELLRDHDVPSRHLNGMEGDLAELDALIQELLDVSRLQLGQSPLHPSAIDFLALAQGIAEPHARVRVHGPSVMRCVDERLVSRAVDNVVRNALSYAPGGDVDITVSAEGFTIEDRGPGVPESALGRLFEPFYRVDSSRSRASGGTGVGLRIVQQVCELHGGHARASLRDGGGLTICLRLQSVPADGTQ
ncbi:MAG: two-component system osmolarity sensor histidine kinase EnvZ [Myxococcota bacterium]